MKECPNGGTTSAANGSARVTSQDIIRDTRHVLACYDVDS